MKEQGSGGTTNNDVSDKKEGAVGGFARVFNGFLHTTSQFRKVPSVSKAEARSKRDQIMRDNGLGGISKPDNSG